MCTYLLDWANINFQEIRNKHFTLLTHLTSTISFTVASIYLFSLRSMFIFIAQRISLCVASSASFMCALELLRWCSIRLMLIKFTWLFKTVNNENYRKSRNWMFYFGWCNMIRQSPTHIHINDKWEKKREKLVNFCLEFHEKSRICWKIFSFFSLNWQPKNQN